jgi:hypothetical protein
MKMKMKMKPINKLFKVQSGNKLDYGKMIIKEGGIPFVSRTSQNNGVVGFVEEINGIKPFSEGLITVSLGGTYVLSSFVQTEHFYTAQNVAVLEPLNDMTLQQKLYYCQCISMNRYKYSAFGREANRTLKEISVPDILEIPNFVTQSVITNYTSMKNVMSTQSINLDIKKWKPFRYDQLFEIERGTGPRKQEIEHGVTPFVTSTDTNNGITAYTNYIPTHAGNTIGVNRNGSVGEAFYQEEPFCSTEDVHIFIPKFKLNKYIAMFLITLIKQEKHRFGYGRKWGIDRMKESIIKLPVKPDGFPDFEFMENYIKSLPYSASI